MGLRVFGDQTLCLVPASIQMLIALPTQYPAPPSPQAAATLPHQLKAGHKPAFFASGLGAAKPVPNTATANTAQNHDRHHS